MGTAKDIYNEILRKLGTRNDLVVIGSRYFPDVFGNFIISFRLDRAERSFVNEQFELFLCDKLGGEGRRRSIVTDIRERTSAQILASIEGMI